MNYILLRSAICLCVFFISPFHLYAQEKAEEEKSLTVMSTRQFIINFFRDSRTCNVDIEVVYKNKPTNKNEKNYLIKISNGTSVDSISLIEPLNFDIFRDRFNEVIDKQCYSDVTIYRSSMNEVFLWIYSVKDVGLTIPLSGKLIINPKIMVLYDTRLDYEYEQRVDTISIREAGHKPITIERDKSISDLNRDIDSIRSGVQRLADKNKEILVSINKINTKINTKNEEEYKKFKEMLLESSVIMKNNGDFFNDPIKFYKPIESYLDTANSNNIKELNLVLDSLKKEVAYRNEYYKDEIVYLSQFKNIQNLKINRIFSDIINDSLDVKKRLQIYDFFNYDKIRRRSIDLNKLFSQVDSSQLKLNKLNIFTIKKISLQFERGFLERIQVWVPNSEGRDVIFENTYAIGFSSIRNFRDFTSIVLFARNSTKTGNDAPHIFLSDVFSNYDNLLQNYTRDYSPADTTINLENMPGNGAVIELRREKYINLFDSKFYTDLVGTNEKSPNGLVQIEVSRRFNINTHRWSWINRTNYGLFNSVTLYGSYNKLENKEKYLQLRNQNVILNGDIISPSYATNLDFRRYEDYSLGIEPNIFLFDSPDNKFTVYADFCARYGHTPLQDQLRTVANGRIRSDSLVNLQGHSYSIYPRLSFEIFAEKRLGFKLSYQYNYTWLFSNNQFKQVASYEKSNLVALPIERNDRKSHMLEFFLKVETSGDMSGRLFLRSRFFMQHGDVNTFFSQIQLGYAYNLVFKK